MIKYVAFAFLLFPVYLVAQNLVPNPNFEEHSQCPDNTDEVNYATGWWGVNNTPDYFDSCATVSYVSVPENFEAYRTAFDGNAYTGVVTYVLPSAGPNYREVIGCKLIDSLLPRNQYLLSIEVSCAGEYGYAIATNNFGMRLSNNYYTNAAPVPIDNFAQVYEDTLIKDTVNWIKLSWTFISDSAYKYLYIGNFFDDNHTDTLIIGSQYSGHSYYFIGSVSITCASASCTNGIENITSQLANIYYDKENEKIKLGIGNNQPYQINLFDITGRRLVNTSLVSSIDVSSYSKGVYLLSIFNNQNIYSKKILIY